ncbi:MAG: nitroreductase family protein [Bacillales bacterium]|nr:nitroreductase family protein [Bacillales bacterium]
MNETITSILNRRSTRKFDVSLKVDSSLIEQILEAALWAPCARGLETTGIYSIESIERVEEIRKMMEEKDGNDSFYGAKVIILFTGRKDNLHDIRNASSAIENAMIAAESLGVSSCWIHRACLLNDEKYHDFFKAIGFKDEEEIMGSVILGYGEKTITKGRNKSFIHRI